MCYKCNITLIALEKVLLALSYYLVAREYHFFKNVTFLKPVQKLKHCCRNKIASREEKCFLENFRNIFRFQNEKGMLSGQTIISIISTNLGPSGASSGKTVGQSSSIRWYPSIFQKPHRFPRNQRFGKSIVLNSLFKTKNIFVFKHHFLQVDPLAESIYS